MSLSLLIELGESIASNPEGIYVTDECECVGKRTDSEPIIIIEYFTNSFKDKIKPMFNNHIFFDCFEEEKIIDNSIPCSASNTISCSKSNTDANDDQTDAVIFPIKIPDIHNSYDYVDPFTEYDDKQKIQKNIGRLGMVALSTVVVMGSAWINLLF